MRKYVQFIKSVHYRRILVVHVWDHCLHKMYRMYQNNKSNIIDLRNISTSYN